MGKPLLGTRNWLAGATLAGGSWRTAWPLANVQDIELALAARSADAVATSTLLTADLGAARAIRFLAITRHNLTASATIRVRAAASPSDVTASPAVDETQNAWLGSNTPATNTGENGRPIHMPCVLVILAAAQSYRYWRVDITDTGNAAGYVEIGYVQAWEAFEFPLGIGLGPTLAPETGTVVVETIGGVQKFDRRAGRRVYRFNTDNLTRAEADVVLRVVRERDLVLPVFIIPDQSPDDPGRHLGRSFLARMRALTPLDQPWHVLERGGWELAEIIG